MKIQIYTMQTASEALAAAAAGVDYLGLTPSNRGLPGEISFETAREIADAVKGKAERVALSVESDLGLIADMVAAVRPDVLHLCGNIALVTPDHVRQLRETLLPLYPELRILQAIPMTGPEALDHAAAFEPYSDSFILDSVAAHIDGIGAKRFVKIARGLQKKYGPGFKVPKLLVDMAEKGETFYQHFDPYGPGEAKKAA